MTGQTLPELIQQARTEAKETLTALEGSGHPQTNESNSLYLGLVTLQKRLAALGAGRAGEVAADLEQLADCASENSSGSSPSSMERRALLAGGRARV